MFFQQIQLRKHGWKVSTNISESCWNFFCITPQIVFQKLLCKLLHRNFLQFATRSWRRIKKLFWIYARFSHISHNEIAGFVTLPSTARKTTKIHSTAQRVGFALINENNKIRKSVRKDDIKWLGEFCMRGNFNAGGIFRLLDSDEKSNYSWEDAFTSTSP